MKHFFSLLLLLLVMMQAAVAQLSISGQITNPKSDLVSLSLEGMRYPGTEPISYEAKLDADGRFTMEIPLREASAASLSHGNEHTALWLQPGKNISLSLDTEAFDETLKYTGAGAEVNNYLAAYYLFDEQLSQGIRDKFKELDADAFITYATSLRDKRLAYLAQHSPKLPPDFVSIQKEIIRYGWGMDLLQYPDMHAYFNGKKEALTVPETYWDFKKDLPLQNAAALGSAAYRAYLQRNLFHDYLKDTPYDEQVYAGLYDYSSTLLSGEPLLYAQATFIHDGLNHGSRQAISGKLQEFLAKSDAAPYQAGLKALDARMAKLAPGEPAPDFKLISLEGKEMALADFAGKVIYLDFWASWCAPCIGEMPASKALKEHFKDRKDVVFLYVSVDDNPEAWKKMIEKQQIEGVHLLSQGWDSAAPKAYNIQGIPRYVLIDRQGRLVDANISRPSDAQTKTKIEEALAAH